MRRALLLLPVLALLLPAAPLHAQDIRALVDRVDRLQRDLDTMQRQVYRGQAPGGAPPPMSMGSGDGLNNAAIARFDARISQLEGTLRDLTGKLEENSYANEQTRRQLDKLSSDLEVRFQQLDQARPSGQAQAPGQAQPSGRPPSPPPQQLQGQAQPAPATTSGNLGSMTQGQLQANAPTPPPATGQRPPQPARPPPAASILPDGSAEDQYKFAFNILLQNDYDQAERAFRAYIDKYPTDPRSENARYWLAETYYVRDKFEPASTAFAEAYQKAPNGQKAPDNLLKLGMSLGKLNKPREACAAFQRLGEQFPNAPGTIKSRSQAEKTRLNCK